MIYIFLGKVNDIFSMEREVRSLLRKENILTEKDFRYVEGGRLHKSLEEIAEPERNTCELQTYKLLNDTESPKKKDEHQIKNKNSFWSKDVNSDDTLCRDSRKSLGF